VVQDAASYQRLLDQFDELQTLEGIKRGLADAQAGRATSLEDFEKGFRKGRGKVLQARAPEDVAHALCVRY
jgi:predicted transcriptional regulator